MLDETVTPMGARLPRRWLNRPLRDRHVLRGRHQAIGSLIDARRHRRCASACAASAILERILARGFALGASARSSTLRDGLAGGPGLRDDIAGIDSPLLHGLVERIGDHAETAALLAHAIVEQPPVLLRDGGVLAEGYDEELDELRRLSTNADQFLVDMEEREKAASGIPTLKVGYNRVHG